MLYEGRTQRHGFLDDSAPGIGQRHIGQPVIVDIAMTLNPAFVLDSLDVSRQGRRVQGQVLSQLLLRGFPPLMQSQQYTPAWHGMPYAAFKGEIGRASCWERVCL